MMCSLSLSLQIKQAWPEFFTTIHFTTQDAVRSLGGRVTSSISTRTDLVLLGMDAGPEKLKKCKELGVKTMYEDAWKELLAAQVIKTH